MQHDAFPTLVRVQRAEPPLCPWHLSPGQTRIENLRMMLRMMSTRSVSASPPWVNNGLNLLVFMVSNTRKLLAFPMTIDAVNIRSELDPSCRQSSIPPRHWFVPRRKYHQGISALAVSIRPLHNLSQCESYSDILVLDQTRLLDVCRAL